MFQGRFQEGFLALGRGRFQMFWEGPNKVTFNRTTNVNSFFTGYCSRCWIWDITWHYHVFFPIFFIFFWHVFLMMIYASISPWVLCTTHSLYLSLQLPFVPLCEAQALKTMDKAKFKAQKITSKAHSEQFILMLGDEYSGDFLACWIWPMCN